MTQAFWKTIEAVPDFATDRRDWQARFGDCWALAERYLKQTSRFVEQVDCPFPGGENCPRQVIQHGDGGVRAVCSDPGRMCDALDLTLDDIKLTALDRRKLLADMARAFGLAPPASLTTKDCVVHIGDRAIAAGVGFPVFACLKSELAPLSAADMAALGRRNLPFVLLVPSLGAMTTDALAAAFGRDGRVLTFEECLQFASPPATGLASSMPPERIFAPEIARLKVGQEPDVKPVMLLPADAKWSDLKFKFAADEVLNVSYRKAPAKRIEPDLLGMKDGRTGKATRQWRLLRLCVGFEGALPRSFPVTTLRGQRLAGAMMKQLDQVKTGYDRQRQLLAKSLIARFGINQDPFTASDDCYDAGFLVDASGLKQGRADQRNRNFAEDD